MLNRAQFKAQLQDGLNTSFGLEYKRYPEEWRGLFDVENSSKAYEEDVLVSGFGAAPVKAEGAGVAYDTASEAWTARYTHKTIALAFPITEEAEEDGLYGSLGKKYSKALARSMVHTKEITGANVYNTGFSALAGDGAAIFSTAHPLTGGGTLGNTLATAADLSESSVEDAVNTIEMWTDERGIPVVVQPKCLAIHPRLQFDAMRILQSSLRSGTADNDANAMKDLGFFPSGVKKNHRFTDVDAWFIVTDCPDGFKHFVRKKIARKMEGDFETGNMRYRARERFSFGVTDWRGGFGVPGA